MFKFLKQLRYLYELNKLKPINIQECYLVSRAALRCKDCSVNEFIHQLGNNSLNMKDLIPRGKQERRNAIVRASPLGLIFNDKETILKLAAASTCSNDKELQRRAGMMGYLTNLAFNSKLDALPIEALYNQFDVKLETTCLNAIKQNSWSVILNTIFDNAESESALVHKLLTSTQSGAIPEEVPLVFREEAFDLAFNLYNKYIMTNKSRTRVRLVDRMSDNPQEKHQRIFSSKDILLSLAAGKRTDGDLYDTDDFHIGPFRIYEGRFSRVELYAYHKGNVNFFLIKTVKYQHSDRGSDLFNIFDEPIRQIYATTEIDAKRLSSHSLICSNISETEKFITSISTSKFNFSGKPKPTKKWWHLWK